MTTAVSDLVLSPAEEDGEKRFSADAGLAGGRPLTSRSRKPPLVSGEYEPRPGKRRTGLCRPKNAVLPIGAVYPGQRSFGTVPANGGWQHGPPGASISADGSTVAWMGQNIGQQARMLPGESPSPLYTEPLWRRIAPGSRTPIERVTGGSDPGNPACCGERRDSGRPRPAKARSKSSRNRLKRARPPGSGAKPGSGGGQGNPVPRLSENGEDVAFISTALPVAIGAGFGTEDAGEPADLYVVNMHAGLTRDQAITPLTRIGGVNEAAAEPITDFDISPNGEQVAFTTARIEFPLGSPAYVSEPAAEAGESRTVRRRPRQRHRHARQPRIRRRPERTAAPVEGRHRRA